MRDDFLRKRLPEQMVLRAMTPEERGEMAFSKAAVLEVTEKVRRCDTCQAILSIYQKKKTCWPCQRSSDAEFVG